MYREHNALNEKHKQLVKEHDSVNKVSYLIENHLNETN